VVQWQLKKEKLDETSNGKLVYDLSKLDESTQLKGGLKAGTSYSIMFSDNTGNETCALMFIQIALVTLPMLQVKIKNSKIKLTHQSIVIKFLGEKMLINMVFH
jgi:hypothetical protein